MNREDLCILDGDMLVFNLESRSLSHLRQIDGEFQEVLFPEGVRSVPVQSMFFEERMTVRNDREELVRFIGHLNGLLAIQCLPQDEKEPGIEKYILLRKQD